MPRRRATEPSGELPGGGSGVGCLEGGDVVERTQWSSRTTLGCSRWICGSYVTSFGSLSDRKGSAIRGWLAPAGVSTRLRTYASQDDPEAHSMTRPAAPTARPALPSGRATPRTTRAWRRAGRCRCRLPPAARRSAPAAPHPSLPPAAPPAAVCRPGAGTGTAQPRLPEPPASPLRAVRGGETGRRAPLTTLLAWPATNGEAVGLDEGLQQQRSVAVASLPVVGQAAAAAGQHRGSEIAHLHPGQDQEAGVVHDQLQAGFALGNAPADEAVAGSRLPGAGAKADDRQHAPLAGDQVAHLCARQGRIAEVVVAVHVLAPQLRFALIGERSYLLPSLPCAPYSSPQAGKRRRSGSTSCASTCAGRCACWRRPCPAAPRC